MAIPPVDPFRTARQVARQRDYARRALQYCAELCGAPRNGWEKDGNDAPLPNAGHYWSVSHKRLWAAAVIADRPVGIDIEHIRPRPRKLHDTLAVPKEWDIMGDRSWHSFYRLWTAKEAVLKATGAGIAGLSRCRLLEVCDELHMNLVHDGKLWRIEHFYHADHLTAVVCDLRPIRWHLREQNPQS